VKCPSRITPVSPVNALALIALLPAPCSFTLSNTCTNYQDVCVETNIVLYERQLAATMHVAQQMLCIDRDNVRRSLPRRSEYVYGHRILRHVASGDEMPLSSHHIHDRIPAN
jgi:hypothetical protein